MPVKSRKRRGRTPRRERLRLANNRAVRAEVERRGGPEAGIYAVVGDGKRLRVGTLWGSIEAAYYVKGPSRGIAFCHPDVLIAMGTDPVPFLRRYEDDDGEVYVHCEVPL